MCVTARDLTLARGSGKQADRQIPFTQKSQSGCKCKVDMAYGWKTTVQWHAQIRDGPGENSNNKSSNQDRANSGITRAEAKGTAMTGQDWRCPKSSSWTRSGHRSGVVSFGCSNMCENSLKSLGLTWGSPAHSGSSDGTTPLSKWPRPWHNGARSQAALTRPLPPGVLATSRQRRPHTGAETATWEPRVGPSPTPAPATTQEDSLGNKGIEQPPSPSQWRKDFRKNPPGTRSQSVTEITTHRNAREAAQTGRGVRAHAPEVCGGTHLGTPPSPALKVSR